ncbi:fungal-specific transcription factor domain-containing protein [Scheffersomyces xylosifermentans]|uniref:fungal-specific transcription factor domain-containing protein n=1 Tax=Scheffersomyces xylosifermentans TaxID=1304137 RepID=UPI00315D7804
MSDGEPSSSATKKRRVKQACDYCRSKKAKCDGKAPTCSTCIVNSETCTYTQSSKRRGLPTGYTHDLEKKVLLFQALIANVIHEIPELGRTIEAKFSAAMVEPVESHKFVGNFNDLQVLWDSGNLSKTVDRFIIDNGNAIHEAKSSTNGLSSISQLQAQQAQQAQQADQRLSQQLNPNNLSGLLNNPIFGVNSNVAQQDFNLINDPSFFLNDDIFQFISDELEENSTDNWEPVALQYHGLSSLISGFTTKAIQQYNNRLLIDHKNPFRVGSIFNVSSSAINASISNTVKLPMEIFQFPPNVRKVVDCYFQIYHPWVPMLDRISILRQVHHLQSFNNSTDKSKLNASDCNLIALVWAIMALGQLGSSTSAANAINNNKLTASYAKNAIMSLENSFTSTIETIQAQVLLGLYFYQLGQWDFSWVLISSGSRMAIDVRLMTPATTYDENSGSMKKSKSATTLDKINRERTWATVYVVNTLLASRMGRSPVVRAMDWPIPSINNEGWEEWETWKCFHSPDDIQLNSGRFLSTFNEFIKVISILNLALTSTIDTSKGMLEDEDDEDSVEKPDIKIAPDERRNSNKLTIAYFKKSLGEWYASLPDYCQLEYYQNSSSVPPMIAFLHLARDLTWCIMAVRLSSLKPSPEGNTVKDKIIRSRDKQYTKAILSIKKIINVNSLKNLKYYPFIDYCILMGFNFPKMMYFEGENPDEIKKSHCEDFRSFLVNAALTSIPCGISWDLYKIMNDFEESYSSMDFDANKRSIKRKAEGYPIKTEQQLRYSMTAPSPYSSMFSQPKGSPSASNNLSNLLNTPTTMNSIDSKDESGPPSTKDTNKSDISSASEISFKPGAGNVGRPRFQGSASSPSREELDLYMMENDVGKNESRMELFMKNLGVIRNNNNISNERDLDDERKTRPGQGAVDKSIKLQQNVLLEAKFTGGNSSNDMDNIGLHEYLQKMAEKNN